MGPRDSQQKEKDELYHALMTLRTPKDFEKFFRDLLTRKELSACSKRWHIARLLNEKTDKKQIAIDARTTHQTIDRVQTWLEQGNGFKLVLGRIKKSQRKTKR